MNILVIGNGFDIAHGFPTKYTDFLDFSRTIFEISLPFKKVGFDSAESLWNDVKKRDNETLMRFEKAWKMECSPRALADFKEMVCPNMWIDYFQKRKENIGDNWIDIEGEIKNVIKSISNGDLEKKENINISDFEAGAQQQIIYGNTSISELLKKISNGKKAYIEYTLYESYKKTLRKDMDRFIMALEIYLDFFVHQLDGDNYSEEIRLHSKDDENAFQKVLSFNYIDNYNKLYVDVDSSVERCMIHGRTHYLDNVKKDIPVEEIMKLNNMVLGFEEYLPDAEKDKKLEFVYYKKYFQRICKGTGSEYLEWLDEWNTTKSIKRVVEVEQDEHPSYKPNHLFIFGHSLDATDKV